MSQGFTPREVIWEITAACPLQCLHCMTSAGRPRPGELTSDEALRVCSELAALGTRNVTIMGGECFLRRDWKVLVERLLSMGIRVAPITSGVGFGKAELRALKNLGVRHISFSLDGDESTHDTLRGYNGAYRRALNGIAAAKAAGLKVGVTTVLFAGNVGEMEHLYGRLTSLAVDIWVLEQMLPVGRGRLNAHLVSPLEGLKRALTDVATMRAERRVDIVQGDTIGYFWSKDTLLRDKPFQGCIAGRLGLGIHSDGEVTGCIGPMSHRKEGNVKRRPLADIWQDPAGFSYTRTRPIGAMEGFCRECRFVKVCRGGCSGACYAHAGRLENLVCLYRHEALGGRAD